MHRQFIYVSRSIYTQARLVPVQSTMDESVPMETGGQAAQPVTAQPASAGAEASASPDPPASAPAVEHEQPQPPAATPAAAASQPEARKPAAKADGDEAKVCQIALPMRLLRSPAHTWQLLLNRSLRAPTPSDPPCRTTNPLPAEPVAVTRKQQASCALSSAHSSGSIASDQAHTGRSSCRRRKLVPQHCGS